MSLPSLLLPAVLICTMPKAAAADRPDKLPQIEGWSRSSTLPDTVYTGDNLRNAFDGPADLFLSYGFVDLRIGEYTNTSGIAVRVELYRHNSGENAFGIYSQERKPDYRFIDIGTQGFLQEKVLSFFCGTHYVKISTHREGPPGDSAMVSIGRRIAEHLRQEPRWPSSLDFFPDEGKIQNAEEFVSMNFLGYEFLRSAYVGRYDSGELVFIIERDSAAQARCLAESTLLALHLRAEPLGDGIRDVTDPNRGPIALLLHGRFFCGAVGARDRELSHWRLGLLRARLIEMERAAVRVNLPKRWKFMTGDDPRYATPVYDDSGWSPIKVGAFWEIQGYSNYDGVAWYRTRTTVTSALRGAGSVGGALLISLGRMDDNDSVYFNGTNIGHTERAGAVRKYLVPFDIVRWDRENTVAVRIDDIGGAGGMNAGPYYIKAARAPDILRIREVGKPLEIDGSSGAPVTRSIKFEFLRPATLTGRLGIRVVNLNTRTIVADSFRHCSIGKGADTSWSYTLRIADGGSYRAQYSFVPDSSSDTVRQSTVTAHYTLPRQEFKLIDPVVRPSVADRSISIPYGDLRLSGYLEERMLANLNQRLLNIDEAGLLDGYLDRPGNQEWVNEYVGKFLSAASRVWRYTQNASLKTQMDRIVDVLLACQKEDGYLGTYLPEDYWLSWDVWGHKYNLIGLLSYYRVTGFEPALEASRKIGDLLCRTFGKEEGKKDIVSSGAWFGLAACSVLDPMVDLFSYTGDKRYLDFCNYIIEAYEQPNRLRVVSTLLSNGKLNGIGGGKAYELLSNLLGLVKLYRAQGDKKLLRAAEAAWTAVARARLYVTGSASSHELFQEEHVLPGGTDAFICEGCVTTEWLHFNEELFRITKDARYMDAMETTLYNHLLAAENPLTGCVSYYTPLQGSRNFQCAVDGNCCLASVPRGIAVIPELVYTRNADNGLSINIYCPGRVNCSIRTRKGIELPVNCEIETRFPETGKVKVIVDPGERARFIVALRVPSWCSGFTAQVSRGTYRGRPGRYLIIDRTWEKKSVINVECKLTTRVLDGGKSYTNCVAVKRGPQVLAMDSGLNPGLKYPDKVRINGRKAHLKADGSTLPSIWSGNQIYTLEAKDSQGKPVAITLVPFADAGQGGGFVRVWLNKE